MWRRHVVQTRSSRHGGRIVVECREADTPVLRARDAETGVHFSPLLRADHLAVVASSIPVALFLGASTKDAVHESNLEVALVLGFGILVVYTSRPTTVVIVRTTAGHGRIPRDGANVRRDG